MKQTVARKESNERPLKIQNIFKNYRSNENFRPHNKTVKIPLIDVNVVRAQQHYDI